MKLFRARHIEALKKLKQPDLSVKERSDTELAALTGLSAVHIARLLNAEDGTAIQNGTWEKIRPYLTPYLTPSVSESDPDDDYSNDGAVKTPASELAFVRRYQRMSPKRPLEAVIMDKLPELSSEGLEAVYDFVRDRIKSEKQTAENPQGEGR